jgi:hypothetical protein
MVFVSPKIEPNNYLILKKKKKVLKPQSKSLEFGRIRLKPLSKNLQISFIISKIKTKDSLNEEEELHNIGFCHGTNLGVGSPKALELDMERQTYQACAKA